MVDKNIFGQSVEDLGFDANKKHFEVIVDTENEKSDVLLVSFVGAAGAFAATPIPEFRKTLAPLGFNLAYAVDKTGTWYNDPIAYQGLHDELTKIQNTLKPKITIFLGNSMGGFGAILYSKKHNPDLVLTFGSQIVIEKWDKRWDKFWNKLHQHSNLYNNMSVVNCFNDTTHYHLIVGDSEYEDVKHHSLVPKKANIIQEVFKGKKHNIALALKRENVLFQTINNIIKNFLNTHVI